MVNKISAIVGWAEVDEVDDKPGGAGEWGRLHSHPPPAGNHFVGRESSNVTLEPLATLVAAKKTRTPAQKHWDFLRPRIKAIVTLQSQWGAVHDM